MNLLYIVRQNTYTVFGGDTVQFEKTKQFLQKKYDIHVEIIGVEDIQDAHIKNADLVHIWGINAGADLDKLAAKINKYNKKIVVSSIYWDTSHSILLKYFISIFFNYNLIPAFEKFNILFNKFIVLICHIIPKYKKKMCYIWGSKTYSVFRKNIINLSDIIIPNSDEEGMLLCKDINLNYNDVKNKFISIPNAVDVDYLRTHKDSGFMSDIKNFVIEAAGIEPLKNQLSAVKALFDMPEIPIVFAGAIRDEKYFKVIKKIADKRGNVYFTGRISPEDLFSLYKRAKVHVLASFRESPGLASLEALMCGSQIVVSNEKFCPVKYYKFDKYGFVCNPYDTKSIRNAVLDAYSSPKDINLPEEYLKFFSYENAADMTYEVYKKILEN